MEGDAVQSWHQNLTCMTVPDFGSTLSQADPPFQPLNLVMEIVPSIILQPDVTCWMGEDHMYKVLDGTSGKGNVVFRVPCSSLQKETTLWHISLVMIPYS